mmetsp:Transcript_57275/g.167619  ORF Transcript_57275/g.167619 Transcript_57275/m.167619 type:complete len:280 (+) Transcript_57275:485-1324(+)
MEGDDAALICDRCVLRKHQHVDLRAHGVSEVEGKLGHAQVLPDAGLRRLLPEHLRKAHAARPADSLLGRFEQGRRLALLQAVGRHANVQLVGHAAAPALLVLVLARLDLLLAVRHVHAGEAEVLLQSHQRDALLYGISQMVRAESHMQVGTLALRQLEGGGVHSLPHTLQQGARITERTRDGKKLLRLRSLVWIWGPKVLQHLHHLCRVAKNENTDLRRARVFVLQLWCRGHKLELQRVEGHDLPVFIPDHLARLLVGHPIVVQRLEGIVDDAPPVAPV